MDKAKLEAVLACIAEGTIFIDADHTIKFVNNRAEIMLNLPKDLVGKDVFACHPESLSQTLIETLDRFRSGSDGVVKMSLAVGDRNLDFSATGVHSEGMYLGALLTIKDVTESVEREEELTSLASQLRAAQDELSTPVVQIWEQVLALPLIGSIDNKRAQTVTEVLLERIVATQSEVVILDITGVHSVDTNVTHHLLKIVSASRLLGAECVITGIGPDIAQTMIHLGVDLDELTTMADMQEGLRYAMDRLKDKK
ncbi:MAG: STAS domain-containing protein [Candidatus Methanogasteraceae archaeon]